MIPNQSMINSDACRESAVCRDCLSSERENIHTHGSDLVNQVILTSGIYMHVHVHTSPSCVYSEYLPVLVVTYLPMIACPNTSPTTPNLSA